MTRAAIDRWVDAWLEGEPVTYDPDNPTRLEPDQIPRCCRHAYQVDAALGHDPEQLRGLDPSGRYVPCDNCLPASLNINPRLTTPPHTPAPPLPPAGLTTIDVPPALHPPAH